MDRTDEMLSKIQKLLRSRTGSEEEGEILEILRSASGEELSDLLGRLDLKRLLSALDDRRFGPDNRTELLTLFAQNAEGLTVESRAKLVDALQAGITNPAREAVLRDLFLATRGQDLTELKNLVDAGEDHRDLQQLLFTDIDDDAIRDAILSHIHSEAGRRGDAVKVLSDIDDTVYPNLKDKRYPRDTRRYPGVVQLFWELDLGPLDTADRPGDLVFLTARPRDRIGIVEDVFTQKKTLSRFGFPPATVLSGDFAHLVGNGAIADKKFENFEEFLKLYPEYSFVFIGDSGQGDAEFGERILDELSEAVRGVLIHDVDPKPDRDQGVLHYFDTYVGAAAKAKELGLISAVGLERVIARTVAELANIEFSDDAQRQARQGELDNDVREARELL